jgi:hypothetical protein
MVARPDEHVAPLRSGGHPADGGKRDQHQSNPRWTLHDGHP